MKIKSFHVKNYKSLFNLPASKFGNINMIYGLNNCGKSNILKFIQLIFQTKFIGQNVKVANEENRRQIANTNFWEGEISDLPYIYSNNNLDVPIDFDITLELLNDEIPHFVELNKEGLINSNRVVSYIFISGQFEYINKSASRIILKKVQLNNKTIFENGEYFPNHKKLSQDQFEEILVEFNNCVMFLDSNRLISNDSTSNSANYDNEINIGNFRNSLFDLYLYDYDKFINLLSAIKSFKVDDQGVEVLKLHLMNSPLEKPEVGFTKFNDEYELMLTNKLGNRYPLSNYGSGIQQLLYILIKIFSSKSKIILIEELELNLSPLYQLELIKFINSETGRVKNRKIDQVFFTTHSKYFYKNTNWVTLYEVYLDRNGHSIINKANKKRTNNYFNTTYY